MTTGTEGAAAMPPASYAPLLAELDRRQFDAAVPVLVMRQTRVGWGGQVSCRILGLKLALATGRRAVFWGDDDPPYAQTFAPMFVPREDGEPEVAFDLDDARDAPVMVCDYLAVERSQDRSWEEIEAIADARIAALLGIDAIDPVRLTGTLLAWMRPLPEIAAAMAEAERRLGISDRTLAIHMRRGDKQIETAFIPPAEFNRRIAALHRRWPFDSVFLASDYANAPALIDVPAGVRLIFDADEKRYNNANAKMLNRTPGLARQETLTAARNVFLLAACGGILGQENANFARLAAGLIAVRGGAADRIDLMDARRIEQADPVTARIFRARRRAREGVKWVLKRLGALD